MSARDWTGEAAKSSPVSSDRVLILDSADANNNKLVTLGNMHLDILGSPQGSLDINDQIMSNVAEIDSNPAGATGRFLEQISISDADDTGNDPLHIINFSRTAGAITTRPFLEIRNNNAAKFQFSEAAFLSQGALVLAGSNLAFMDIGEMTPPSAPAANSIRLFIDSSDELLKSKDSANATLSYLTTPVQLAVNANAQNLTNVGLFNVKIDNQTAVMEMEANHTVPAAGQNIAQIDFIDDNAIGERTDYVQLETEIQDPSDSSEDGALRIRVRNAGSLQEYMSFNNAGNETISLAKALSAITISATAAEISSFVNFTETTTPSAPAANNARIYVDSADALLKKRTSSGVVSTVEIPPANRTITQVISGKSFDQTGATVRFLDLFGGGTENATESNVQRTIPQAITLKAFRTRVLDATGSGSWSLDIRDDGASIGAYAQTGGYTVGVESENDTDHSVAAGSAVNLRLDLTGNTGTFLIEWFLTYEITL